MSGVRHIRLGDYAVIDDIPRLITHIDRTGIYSGPIRIISSNQQWVIKDSEQKHTITFRAAPSLRIATFNLGHNIVMNMVAGSEAGMVQKCQVEYGTSAMCTINAITLLKDYNLIGLQEVPETKRDFIMSLFPSHYQYIPGHNIMTVYDSNITGPGHSITPPNDLLLERGFQIIYFPHISLLFVNLHAPHNIDIKYEVEKKCHQYKQRADRVIMVGDFNDFMGTITHLDVLGHRLTRHEKVKTCCADSHYTYPGDYILISDKYWTYYGYPRGYIRHHPLMSDHDPVVLLTYN
jgi:hypothetical protein